MHLEETSFSEEVSENTISEEELTNPCKIYLNNFKPNR